MPRMLSLHGEMGWSRHSQGDSQIQDTRWPGLERDAHDILKLRHITPDDSHLIAQACANEAPGLISIHTTCSPRATSRRMARGQ